MADQLRKDHGKLFFPKEIVDEIGLSANEINALKKLGCPFFGLKTTIRWVRTFIAERAKATKRAVSEPEGNPLVASRR